VNKSIIALHSNSTLACRYSTIIKYRGFGLFTQMTHLYHNVLGYGTVIWKSKVISATSFLNISSKISLSKGNVIEIRGSRAPFHWNRNSVYKHFLTDSRPHRRSVYHRSFSAATRAMRKMGRRGGQFCACHRQRWVMILYYNI